MIVPYFTKMKPSIILTALIVFIYSSSFAQSTKLIQLNNNGQLVYTADEKGNTIPDFSGVGYKNSETTIPTYIPVVKTVAAVAGDNLNNIQNAIDEVSKLPLNKEGFRGTILFKKGTYLVSDTIHITASGIVLKGEGNDEHGTHFIATKKKQHTLFNFKGEAGIQIDYSSKQKITSSFIPIGSKVISVAKSKTFKVNDCVVLHHIPNQKWIDQLNMAQWGWKANAYDIFYERKITSIVGNNIVLDAPVVDVIDTTYTKAELIKYASARIENCGIENMRISSEYASATDEEHGWTAVGFDNIINSWAKNLEVYYFGYAAVKIEAHAAWISVDSCKMIDPISEITGGRRYSFDIHGQRSLVQNCFTRNGRHDYVTSSRTAGPNVFYNCVATKQQNDIGPHHRWATGILFDNIIGDGNMNVQNRGKSGSGHGWAGAQIMYWNCKANKMVIQKPEGDHYNWAIGCIATEITEQGMTTEPLGTVESLGKPINNICSLFITQLNERLNKSQQ